MTARRRAASSTSSASTRWRRSPPARIACACSTSWAASRARSRRSATPGRGGNVVFGTSPGRRGQVLETPAGNIPVYNNVREGLEAGHRFNCGVVYLPPSAPPTTAWSS